MNQIKKTGFFLLFLVFSGTLFSQLTHTDSLSQFHQNKTKINRTGMYILGGFAVANISSGLIMRSQTTGVTSKFHEMNALWNTVNLGLSVGGLLNRNNPNQTGDLKSILKKQLQLENIFLVNGLLDIVYMTAGAALLQRAQIPGMNQPQLKGYGNSLILQGLSLLVFDSWMYQRNKNNRKLIW